MKPRMRALPPLSKRGTTSTSTKRVTLAGPARYAARMPVSPPMLVPMIVAGRPTASSTRMTSQHPIDTLAFANTSCDRRLGTRVDAARARPEGDWQAKVELRTITVPISRCTPSPRSRR